MDQLGTFVITAATSLDFARASGDFNPLHLAPVTARRTQFGRTLIHGVCGTLKALDLLLQDRQENARLKSIRVKYSKPVSQDQPLSVTCSDNDNNGDSIRLELSVDTTRCQIIDLELEPAGADTPDLSAQFPTYSEDMATCMELAIENCDELSAAVDLLWQQDVVHSLFPHAARYLPREQLATLMASTRIVGMECPGLHSVFAGLELNFSADSTAPERHLHYRVSKTDARIDQVVMQVHNAWAEGTIEAFFRAAPAQQASFTAISPLVPAKEFSDQNALVIGASRGLGEVISKVLGAGGARLMMTYAAGREDAEGVAADIAQAQQAPGICHYNVLEDSWSEELQAFFASVTHIYYLASPTISKGDSKRWDTQLFNRYCDFYLHGMARLVQQIRDSRESQGELQLFIPSSVFLEEKTRGFAEYTAAKAAAEAYATNLDNSLRDWHIAAPRLPRLHTDQTSGVRGTDEQKTLTVIIEQLGALYGATLKNQSSSD